MPRALITGASRGIGLACARMLATQGWQVSGLARDFSVCDFEFYSTHAVDLSELDKLPELLQSEFDASAFDLLILNAGYGQFGGMEQFSFPQMRRLIDTNLTANLFLIKYFLPEFKRRGQADIVLLGSESALQGGRQGAVYSASKFAVRGLAQSLRADCADADVRVVLVNPGPVDTDFFADLHFKPRSGVDYALAASSVADAIVNAVAQPRNCVIEEINLQPPKRAFDKRGR